MIRSKWVRNIVKTLEEKAVRHLREKSVTEEKAEK